MGWKLSLLSRTGRRRKLGGKKHLLGWQDSLWDFALCQLGIRASELAAGPSKAEGIAPHVAAETPWPLIQVLIWPFHSPEQKPKGHLFLALATVPPVLGRAGGRTEEGQEQDTSQH